MRKRKPKSAAAFLSELKGDAKHLKRQGTRQDNRVLREAEIQVLTQGLRDDLAAAGYAVSTIGELVPRYGRLGDTAVSVLLDHLSQVGDPNVQEEIIRALGASAISFDGRRLTGLFETTQSPALRYAIANTFAEARPLNVGEWVLNALRHRAYGEARQMLALAAARMSAPDVANPALLDLMEELPGHAALALSESGRPQDIPALEGAYAHAKGWVRRQIGQAISVISRRQGRS